MAQAGRAGGRLGLDTSHRLGTGPGGVGKAGRRGPSCWEKTPNDDVATGYDGKTMGRAGICPYLFLILLFVNSQGQHLVLKKLRQLFYFQVTCEENVFC